MSRITSGNNLQSHCQPSSFAFYDLRSLPAIICSFFLLFFFRFDPAYCSSWKKIFFSYYSYIIVVMSECECEWIFSVLAFCSVATQWKGEAVTFWWQSRLGIWKKKKFEAPKILWLIEIKSAYWHVHIQISQLLVVVPYKIEKVSNLRHKIMFGCNQNYLGSIKITSRKGQRWSLFFFLIQHNIFLTLSRV